MSAQVEVSTRPTWAQLIALEPRLAALYRKAAAIKDNGEAEEFCANSHWYGYFGEPGLKPHLLALVGFERLRRPDDAKILYSSAAYDVAYQHIYSALPDCRNCSWCG